MTVEPDLTTPLLPAWAVVSDKRRAHIARVTLLLARWANEMAIEPEEAQAWHDAGRWHDALRDASDADLRALAGDTAYAASPVGVLHGPAAAALLERDGESRAGVLMAVRWHTVGNANWDRTGRALFMADFLEPGRTFMQADRAFLASLLPRDFDGVFRQLVRMRLEWTLREGKALFPESVALWNSVR
jgi:2-amino-4-hydroxy-6-hydroxymethyldihydropteridine diphosphokinase